MSLQAMIDAARSGNAVEFEKTFQSETKARLSEALAQVRAGVVAEMIGIAEAKGTMDPDEVNQDDDEDNNT